jgi:hypothetical protein
MQDCFCAIEGLAWCFVFYSNGVKVRATTYLEFSSTFQGENPRFGLNCLCLAMSLLEALF